MAAIHRSQAADNLWREQEQTRAALDKAEKQYALAERRSALLAMERGLTLCEQDKVGAGMLWLALRALLQHADGCGGVAAVAFSPDGKTILTGGYGPG